MHKYFPFILIICIAFTTGSCKRTLDVVGEYDTNTNGTNAYLKFIHASPNFRSIWNQPDSLNLFVNNTKLNVATLSYNSMFPFSVNASTNSITATYAMVPAGAVQIKLSVAGSVNADSIPVLQLDRVLGAGGYYTFLLTDSIGRDRDSSKIFVADSAAIPALPGSYNLRFINATVTSPDSIDVFSFSRNRNIITAMKANQISSFITLGYNASVIDTIIVKKKATPAGSGAVLVKFPLNSLNLGSGSLEGRSFTLYYQGDPLLTGAKAPAVRSYLNF